MIEAAVLPVMIYAGYKDIKLRLIPDRVHVMLIIIGIAEMWLLSESSLFYISAGERLAGLVPAFLFLILHLLGKEIGGGDYKIVNALGFCLGIHGVICAIFIASIGGVLVSVITKEKSIPLAAYLAAGTTAYYLIVIL